ncbi:P-loop NTPase [Agreia sp. COWG]|uniref:AAA family ATPase n=1 Tax=Agreia sp. COWG TaxID=2773266 RepID=UPI001F1F816E|nr:P-loop NTPase [Agreia sp. COWG]
MRIVTCLDTAADDRLVQELSAEGHDLVARVQTAHELIDILRQRQLDGVVVSASGRQLTLEVLAEADEVGIRLVAVAEDDAERRYALSLGLYEVVDSHAPWREVELQLRGGVAIPREAAPERGAGRVIAVWGPAGAPGRSTVAIQLAAELAFRSKSVVLVDADTYGGTIAPALGMLDESPSFAAACRLASHNSLTVPELERVASRYTSPHGAFWILSGIGRPSRWPELGADRVTATIGVCRAWTDYIVVDTGFSLEADEEISSDLFAPRRNAATLAALRQADHVIAVGSADPVGLSRLLRAHVDLLEAIETSEVTMVVNRLRASAVGSNARHQVRQTLQRFGGVDEPIFLPLDVAGADAAVLAGKTIIDAAPRSAIRAGIAQLVDDRILAADDEPPSRRAARKAARQGRPTRSRQTLLPRRLG